MIYLASPYTDPEETVRQERQRAAMKAVAHWTKVGRIIYSPICHYHEVSVKYDLPHTFAFWERINYGMLRLAEELWILKIPGYMESVGVAAEVEMALNLGIPVFGLDPHTNSVRLMARAK